MSTNTPGDNISHPGTVVQLNEKSLRVRVESQAACGNCASKAYCGMSEMQEKIIEIPVRDKTDYSPGQSVTVMLEKSLGYKALLLGYLLPFVILVAGIALMLTITGSEPLAALIGLLLMIPYYGWLYYRRDQMRASFRFRLREESQKMRK